MWSFVEWAVAVWDNGKVLGMGDVEVAQRCECN